MKEGRKFLRSLPSLLGVSTYAMLAGHMYSRHCATISRTSRKNSEVGARRKRRREGKKRKDLLESKIKEHQNKRKKERKKERNISTPVNTPHPHRKRLYSSEHPQTASRLLVNCQSAEKVLSRTVFKVRLNINLVD